MDAKIETLEGRSGKQPALAEVPATKVADSTQHLVSEQPALAEVPATNAADSMQHLVSELERTAKGLVHAGLAIQEILDKLVLPLGEQLMQIPSSFFSDRLGGSSTQGPNDLENAKSRLDVICQRAKITLAENLESSADGITVEDGDILSYKIMPSGSTAAKGDREGYPLARLVKIRQDQEWLRMKNANFIARLPVLQAEKFAGFSKHERDLYEHQIAAIIQGTFSGQPDCSKFQKALKAPESEHQCENLAAFTAVAMDAFFINHSSTTKECVALLNSITDPLDLIFDFFLPKLSSTVNIKFDDNEIRASLVKMKSWWKGSPFKAIQANLVPNGSAPANVQSSGLTRNTSRNLASSNLPSPGGDHHYEAKVRNTTPVIFTLNMLMEQLKVITIQTPLIKMMHPEGIEGDVTPIHAYASKLLAVARRHLIPQTKTIGELIGKSSEYGEPTETLGFSYVYKTLKSLYTKHYGVNFDKKAIESPSAIVTGAVGEDSTMNGRRNSLTTQQAPCVSSHRNAFHASSDGSGQKSPLPSPRKSAASSNGPGSPRTVPPPTSVSSHTGLTPRSPRSQVGSTAGSPRIDPDGQTTMQNSQQDKKPTVVLTASSMSTAVVPRVRNAVLSGPPTTPASPPTDRRGSGPPSLRRISITNRAEKAITENTFVAPGTLAAEEVQPAGLTSSGTHIN